MYGGEFSEYLVCSARQPYSDNGRKLLSPIRVFVRQERFETIQNQLYSCLYIYVKERERERERERDDGAPMNGWTFDLTRCLC